MKLHPETAQLVDDFAAAMKAKLLETQRKRIEAGLDPIAWKIAGPPAPNWPATELRRHIPKGDPLDVAACAAFCWFHQIGTDAL